MYPIKLGIIGCGIAARDLHWPALKELKDKYEITMVCNHTEDKAKSFAEVTGGVPYVMDYHELLKNPDIEAVDIALPIELNYLVSADSLAAGKHVITEKPLASSLSEGRKMVELAGKYPLVTMVAEHFRYKEAFQRVKTVIEEGVIGDVMTVFWNSFDRVHPDNNKYARTKWRIHHKYPGGFPVDGGVHNIAALRDIFGEITGTGSFSKSFNPEIGEIDSLSFQFKTEKNISGVFNSFFSVNGFNENRLIILGTNGSLILDDEDLTVNNGSNIILKENFKHSLGFKEEFEDFYEAVRNGKHVKSSFFEAYSDLKGILDAVSLGSGS